MSTDPWDPLSWTPGAPYEGPRASRFPSLDGEEIPLQQPAASKWTQQSSVAEPYGNGHFARATQFEIAPWWTIDLAGPFAIERVKLEIAALPAGARVKLSAYTYAGVTGQPPHNAPSIELDLSAFSQGEKGSLSLCLDVDWVARFVRVELAMDARTQLSLKVLGFSVDATELFANTLRHSYLRAFSRFADRPLFSVRERPGEGAFIVTHTYRALWGESLKLAAALARRVEPTRNERIFLGLIMGHRPEWLAGELAAVHRGYVVVPLAPDDSDDRLRSILARCPLDVVLCDRASLERLRALDERPRLLVCIDEVAQDVIDDSPGEIQRYRALVEEPLGAVPAPSVRAESDLHTVIFTSGSTGTPKGAMRSYARFNAVIESYGAGQPSFHLSFQPLSHLSERNYLPSAVLNGAHVGLSSGSAHVLSDIEAFEPTWVSSVPRLFEAVFAIYRQRSSAEIAAHPEDSAEVTEARVLAATRAKFGRRLQGVAVGSAPVSDALLRFLQRLFAGLWVQTGYGSTEVGTIAGNNILAANVHVKIVPLEELGPNPPGVERGELLVRTPHLIDGYFNDPDTTAASLDDEGFFRTGDIVERREDKTLRVIGRRSNSVKLASGEFVALDRIESVLSAHSLVQSILVALDRRGASVVAVIVPHPEALSLDASAASVLAALREHGAREGLKSWEIPSAIVLDDVPFTVESGLLTTSNKVARRVAEARYRARLDALDVVAVPSPSSDDTLLSRVVSAVSSVVSRVISPDESLHESVARDSLVAAELIATVGAVLGRELSLREWSSAKTLRALVDGQGVSQIELMRADLAIGPPARVRDRRVSANSQVVLTGATGLVGAHVLEAAVRDTRASVLCLVRASDERDARARVEATLSRYGIDGLAAERWRAVPIASRWSDAVASEGASVVHCAAAVNWLATYEAVRESNVALTRLLIEWASGAGAPLHFVSTVSTVASDGDERSVLSIERAALQSGYGASKWVAEMLVRSARERGLATCVHRPGLVTGHSQRGLGNLDDFVHRYLVACARFGVALDAADTMDMTPVDYVCAAIVSALGDPDAIGRVLHLNNVRGALRFDQLGRVMTECGARCELVDYRTFRARAVAPSDSPLRALSGYFTDAGFYLGSGPWPDRESRAWLAQRNVVCPAIDRAVIERYLRGAKIIS